MPSMLSRSGLGWGCLAVAPSVGHFPMSASSVFRSGGRPSAPVRFSTPLDVRGAARVGEVEADRVADAGGEAALQDEQAAVAGGGDVGDAEAGVAAVGVLGAEREVRLRVRARSRSGSGRCRDRRRRARPPWRRSGCGRRAAGSGPRTSGSWWRGRRGHAEGVRHGEARRGGAVAVVAADGRLDLGRDEPGAVGLDDEASESSGGPFSSARGTTLVGFLVRRVEVEQRRAVAEGERCCRPCRPRARRSCRRRCRRTWSCRARRRTVDGHRRRAGVAAARGLDVGSRRRDRSGDGNEGDRGGHGGEGEC